MRELSVDKKEKKKKIWALYSLLPRTGTKMDSAGEVLRKQAVDGNYCHCQAKVEIC